VGVEPYADAVDVELVSASRQHARRLPGRELRDAYDAPQRLALAHLPLRHRLVTQIAFIAPHCVRSSASAAEQ
jgi:hypothetical protein